MIQEINKRVTCKADYRKELRSRLGATEGERIYTMLTPDLDRTFALFEKRAENIDMRKENESITIVVSLKKDPKRDSDRSGTGATDFSF